MKLFRIKNWAIALSFLWCLSCNSGQMQIQNNLMLVNYDGDTGEFTIGKLQSETPFVSKGKFDEVGGTATVENQNDPKWGVGKCIKIVHPSGNIDRISLYPDFPFAHIQKTIVNNSPKAITIEKVRPNEFVIQVGSGKAGDLALRSTGALTHLKNDSTGSYLFAAIADASTREGVVCGWLSNYRGSGVVFARKKDEQAIINTQIDYGALKIKNGVAEELEEFLIGSFDDTRLGLETFADLIALKNDIKLKNKPSLYCTWYNTFRGTNEQNLAKTVDIIEDKLLNYGLNVVQIDDGWQAGVSPQGPARDFFHVNESYASGMKATADKIKSAGLTAGLWFKPFSGTVSDPWFADKQDLFVTKDGKPYNARWGGDCLDMSNPKAQDYLRDLVHLISKDWGYKYFKIDGMWVGSATRQMYINTYYADDKIGESKLFDSSVTHIEAYRKGLEILKNEAGDDVYVLGCNLSQNMRTLGASFGLVDGMRIGPDNRPAYPAILKGPLFGARLYFLHNRVWHNDPDPLYVRDDLALNDARLLCSWGALNGNLTTFSTDYEKLSSERLDLVRRCLPSHNLTARPVDFFDNDSPSVWMVDDNKNNRRLVGLFNWGKSEADVLEEAKRFKDDDIEIANKKKKKVGDEIIPTKPMNPAFSYDMDWIGLSPDDYYVGFEYWSNKFISPFIGKLERTVPSRTCQILSLVKQSDTPQVISTSRSISQGVVDLIETSWKSGDNQLSGRSRITGKDAYEIRIVAMNGTGFWSCKGVTISEEDQNAGVKIKLIKQDAWKVRIKIYSPDDREVKWAIQF